MGKEAKTEVIETEEEQGVEFFEAEEVIESEFDIPVLVDASLLDDPKDLVKRAYIVKYRSIIPTMPEANKKIPKEHRSKHLKSRMVGYRKRMRNWLSGLVIAETELSRFKRSY